MIIFYELFFDEFQDFCHILLIYQNIKNFALEQLEITEADDYEWDEKLLKEYRNTTVQDYKLPHIKSAIREVELYKEQIESSKGKRLGEGTIHTAYFVSILNGKITATNVVNNNEKGLKTNISIPVYKI